MYVLCIREKYTINRKALVSLLASFLLLLLAAGGYWYFIAGRPSDAQLRLSVLEYHQIRLKNEVENMLGNHERKMVEDYYARIGYGSFPDYKKMEIKRIEFLRIRADDRGGYVASIALETRVDNFVMNESGKYTFISFQEKWTVIQYRPDPVIRFSE